MNGCLTDEETRHLLLHELAHLNRRDDWALLIERTIEAFCWWHPVVRWVGSRLEQEREEACDQLAATGEEPRRYASTLVHLAEISKAAGSRLAPGALRGQLSRRVEALLATPALGRGRLVHRVPAFSLSLVILTVGSRVAPPSIVARTPVPDSIPAAAPPTSGAAVASLDSLFTAYADSGFSGTILLARHGRIVLEKGYGLADRERGIPATAETRYSTAGMTKLFTAAAILDLAETGRLSLQDPASRWFGELGRTKGTVTLDQLLTYRDGLTRLNAPVQRDDPSAFLQALAAAPASFTPGSGYRYSDHGHSLLGLVIEAASGESYESYVRRRFIGPAGLTHTGFENEPGSVAVEYSGPADALAPVGPRAYRWGRRASLGLVSTAGDLYRWFNKLSDPAVISPAVREQLFQVRTRTDYNTDQAYGLELVDRERGHRLWRRVAGTPGFEGELLHDPDNDWTAVILVNTRLGWRFKVWREIERVMWSVPGSPSTS
jgi:CubicO group peptidase (beta-lactamase class C family)